MRKQFILIALLCFYTSAYAQQPDLIPYRKGDLWGYADPSAKIVIEPAYHRTYFFSSDDLARIQVNGLFGYIDAQGKNRIEPQFAQASDFYMGIARVQVNNREFCIDTEGREDECHDESNETETQEGTEQEAFTIQQTGQHYQLVINNSGDTVDHLFDHIDVISRYFFPQTNHFAIVTKNGLKGAYNEQGILITPPQYKQLEILDMLSYKAVQKERWGVLKVDGSTVLPFVYDSIGKVNEMLFSDDSIRHNDHYVVRKHDQYGVVNSKNKWILKPAYDKIVIPKACSCPLEYIIQVNGVYGIANHKGEVIIPAQYAAIEPFYSASVTRVVTRAGKEGYISKTGLLYFSD